MSRLHPLAVEPVAKALPNRKRVEADLRVQPAVGATTDLVAWRDTRREELIRSDHLHARRTPGPLPLAFSQDQRKPLTEARPQVLDDPRIEEEARREGIRQDDPGRSHETSFTSAGATTSAH